MFVKNARLLVAMAGFVSALTFAGHGVGEEVSRTDRVDAVDAKVIPAKFVHPGISHSIDDIEFVRAKIAAGEQPWTDAWDQLTKSRYASLDFDPSPRQHVERGPSNHPDIGSSDFSADGRAAYTHALQWVLSGDEAHARKSAEILDAWSSTLKTIQNHDARLLTGMSGLAFCNAAELLQHCWDGWPSSSQQQFQEMLRRVWYPIIKDFYPSANGNWDASMIQTMIAMGVYLDDRSMFDRAVEYFLEGEGNGAIGNYFNDFGECQESGRDQAHTQMGMEFLANACETGQIQGVDLYGAMNNRLLLGFEYTAKFNLGDDVPYEPYISFEKRYHYKKISEVSRGSLRPTYEKVFSHYHRRLGIAAPSTEKAVLKVRQHDKSRSREHSSLPWETLMFACDGIRRDAKPKVVCFGDSITKRGYPKLLGELLSVDSINSGVAGHTSSQGLHRMSSDVLDQHPDVVVIFFGTNDLRVDSNKFVTPGRYAKNLEQMTTTCRTQGIEVVICSLPPIKEASYFKKHELERYVAAGGLSKMIADYRMAAIEVARKNGVSLVDLNELLPKTPQWLSDDGVHPSSEGCQIIAELIADAVRPLVKSTNPAGH